MSANTFSYEEICTLVGQLYLNYQATSKRLESECQRLFLKLQECEKLVQAQGNDDELPSKRASS